MSQTKKKTTVSINLEMSAETNQGVTLAAKAAKRSKHIEAALRLEDHVGVRLENGKYPTLRPFFKQQVFAVLL
ncbi:TraY domain-containing protein [Shewanella baltica]|mgnify:CR=1 FL=1|uniref:TraY domain-containing protein n=1 Tax=Shewanella baltica TaxID=62322 RepID=UPI00021130CB|nr:TraY domain-containing protein [Shewanella baltica]AEH16405.1 hypothetical protein Sbal117_4774 [Shewanella baltica OS117]